MTENNIQNPIYNSTNEYIKKKYENDLLHGLHRDLKTVKEIWRNINLLESFTNKQDFIKFKKSDSIKFKDWLFKRKNKDNELLSLSTVKTILHNLRGFFDWLLKQKRYRTKLDGNISLYLNLSNNENRAARATKEKSIPTYKQLEKTLLAMPSDTDVEKRNRAIFACVIITCARVNALITLKVKDFDRNTRMLWQDPKHVKTKFRKGIETRLVSATMPIAEEIFIEWFDYIVNQLGFEANDPIFSKQERGIPFTPLDFQNIGLTKCHWATSQPIRKIFKGAFENVRMEYFNPHSFRKTLVRWGLNNCTLKEIKAMSRNLGHQHINTTMNSYADISVEEQRISIEGIGETKVDLKNLSKDDLMKALELKMR